MSINNKTVSSNRGFVRDYLKGKSFDFSEWNPVKTYINDSFKQDFVKYNGCLYACIHTNTNVVPGTTDCWLLVVASENGKSAYEIWLENGNVGSEEDFLEAYRGYPGEKGETGAPGLPGNKVNIGPGEPVINGVDDDLYINSDNGDIYKFDSVWKLVGSLGTKISLVEISSQLTDFEKSEVRSNLGIDIDTFALKSDLEVFDWEEI